jgi:poly(hydroxyalkanoate) depolymerase family esterase
MRPLSDTLARLAALRAGRMTVSPDHAANLKNLEAFGANPGMLSARYAVPEKQGERSALVVILHGCSQTADGYDAATGWSRLGREHGFAVLYPEQQRANNGNLCFNWFRPDDTNRDSGEVLSIRQMIATMVASHDIDERHVYITGLSAGGAMALAMLATYPAVFAGGAIVAGLAYGCAASVPEAFDRMRGHGMPTSAELGKRLRAASPHDGRWPTLSIWQGSRDNTVVPDNADAIVEQWRGVHDVAAQPTKDLVLDGHQQQVWSDADGRDCISLYRIVGMGHGTPLDISNGDEVAAPFMLEAGISSTRHIAHGWGLIPSAGSPQPDGNTSPIPHRHENPMQALFETMLRSTGFIR